MPSATVCHVHIESEYDSRRQSVFVIVRLLKVHCAIVYTAEDDTVATCSLCSLLVTSLFSKDLRSLSMQFHKRAAGTRSKDISQSFALLIVVS